MSNQNIDFVAAHIKFVNDNKNYMSFLVDPLDPHSPAIQLAQYYAYIEKANPRLLQEHAKRNLLRDQQKFQAIVDYNKQQKHLFNKNQKPLWFITIGFNHQTWSVDVCKKVIERVISLPWVLACKANFELFRENGEHPHCHFLIYSDLPKSKIMEKLWAVKDIKKVVLKKTFIDIKKGEECHQKYIMLDKQEDKMKYVAQDIEWRKENQIPDYEKNPADLGI